MKIAVVAANGKAGQLIVEEALNRGHDEHGRVQFFVQLFATAFRQNQAAARTRQGFVGGVA